MIWAIVAAVICLAYANGANDNFKGVATLFGSGTTDYRRALMWATVTTACGSLTAVFLAEGLLKNFSGKGLVSDSLVSSPQYVAAVALGAGMTVLLATKLGMPISTTHSLVGALVGAGWCASSPVNVGKLTGSFFLPMLFSPLLAIFVTSLAYLALNSARRRLGVQHESCFCAGTEVVEVVAELGHAAAMERVERLTVSVGTPVTCHNRYAGSLWGVQASTVLDQMHYLSAGIVSFARGLNDTPKIAALLLLVPLFGAWGTTTLVGAMIAIGGLISARKVAELMSQKITPMNHGQGLTANIITGVIVIGASRWGLPVSTTHVSCGALFGIGIVRQNAQGGTILKILIAWITTLPAGAALGAGCFWLLGGVAP